MAPSRSCLNCFALPRLTYAAVYLGSSSMARVLSPMAPSKSPLAALASPLLAKAAAAFVAMAPEGACADISMPDSNNMAGARILMSGFMEGKSKIKDSGCSYLSHGGRFPKLHFDGRPRVGGGGRHHPKSHFLNLQ